MTIMGMGTAEAERGRGGQATTGLHRPSVDPMPPKPLDVQYGPSANAIVGGAGRAVNRIVIRRDGVNTDETSVPKPRFACVDHR